MQKYAILAFLTLIFLSVSSIAFAKETPANCTYSVINNWTQTIRYQCSENINLNGAKIQFTVDNPAGLTNLNSVWGFSNLSQYPSNPILTLNGNIVTLELNFPNGTPVMLNIGKTTDFSYSTTNNVRVQSFSLYPAGTTTKDASLNISLLSKKPADINATTVLVHVKEASGIDHPIHVPWEGSAVLTNLNSGAFYFLSAEPLNSSTNRYTFTFTPSTITLSKGTNYATAVISNSVAKGVKGWPKYLAMGAVTDNTTSSTNSFLTRYIDAIFKYGGLGGNGDPGQIIYPIFDLQTANQAKNLTAYYKQNNINNIVKPVMVIYTAQMSGGTSFTDFEMTNLVMHYITLLMEAQKLQSYQTIENPYPASIILNPDLFGMVQQQNLLQDLNAAIAQVSLHTALRTAICFITHTINTPYGQNLNYESLFQAIRKQTTDDWSAMSIWDQYKMQYFNNCTARPDIPTNITIPAFTNDFPGWVQSTNWLLKKFSPNVTFGWQENLWAIGSSLWVHKNYTPTALKSQIADPTAALIIATKAYAQPYPADFLVIDKYEMDSIPSATGIGYLFNARDWFNVLLFTKSISESLGTVPIMLWQVPGGHLQVTNDIDTRVNHASTEPDFFFGDEINPLPNLQPFILNTVLPPSIYNTSSIQNYLSMNESGATGSYNWQTNHLLLTANSHVFALLWGGGNTTSVGTFPSNDNGWLANKIKNYYKNPVPIS